MAISTYSDLQTAIASWLHRADLGSVIPDFITMGEDRIYRSLRVRDMEEEINDTIDADGTWTLPADYVDLKELHTDTDPIRWLERKTAEWIYRNDPSTVQDVPRYVARERDKLIFAPFPASQYGIKGTYYKRFPTIATSLNDVFTNNPALWLFASLIESAPYLKNESRLPMWEAKFSQVVLELNAEENRENYSGSRLAMTAE